MADEAALPRVFLRPLLLVALSGGDAHGYDLAERLWGMGLATADLAGVYRTLRSLEHEHLVESWWEPSEEGPKRRVYRLNDSGVAEAERQVDWIAAVRHLLGDAIGFRDAVGSRDTSHRATT